MKSSFHNLLTESRGRVHHRSRSIHIAAIELNQTVANVQFSSITVIWNWLHTLAIAALIYVIVMICWMHTTVCIFANRVISALLGNGLVISEGKLHAMHKRLMMPSFNTHSVASWYIFSLFQGDHFLKNLEMPDNFAFVRELSGDC